LVKLLPRYHDFPAFKIGYPPSWFLEVRILETCSEGHFVSTCQISCCLSNRFGDTAIFEFCNRLPSWICCVRMWTTHRAFGSVHHCTKFGWNQCSSFNNKKVLIFIVWLENAYWYPQNGFLGDPCHTRYRLLRLVNPFLHISW